MAAPKGPATHVDSPLEPMFDAHSRVLMLGTMPSPKSREVGYHYGNPQNRFWRVMAAICGEEPPTCREECRALALLHHFALDDVLKSCTIVGASDASIRDAVPNDLRARVLDHAPIRAIFCTGAASHRLYRRYIEPELGIPATRLPSTSPANASWSLPRLVEAYGVVKRYLQE
ncbi:DNA-deoxyinosine glycosylase [Parafannyhessea umbonata]|uniref:DNA-deoxyinosine glycosylase n=1 Tax=Parafannyhessea umbonata TaxID=604330 RepID=UPI003AB70275